MVTIFRYDAKKTADSCCPLVEMTENLKREQSVMNYQLRGFTVLLMQAADSRNRLSVIKACG